MKPRLKALLDDVLELTTYFEMCWKPDVALGCAENRILPYTPVVFCWSFLTKLTTY